MDSEENAPGPRLVAGAEEDSFAPGALPAEQMAFVRAIQEDFLRGFARQVANRLETPVEAHMSAMQRVSRSTFLHSQEDGGHMLVLETEPAGSQVLVAFSAGLAACFLRSLLGAPPAADAGPSALTEIELYILHEVFDLLVEEANRAWKSCGIAFRVGSTETPDATAGQESMLVASCRVDMDETQEGFRIAVPAFLARLAALHALRGSTGAAPGISILASLRHARLRVEAVLPGSTVSMADLLAMEPGHLLMLSRAAGSPLECRINGKPKFQGEWLARGNRQALELL